MQMESNTGAMCPQNGSLREEERVAISPMEERRIPVKGSMVKTGVNSQRRGATTNMSARDVESEAMANPVAQWTAIKETDHGMICQNTFAITYGIQTLILHQAQLTGQNQPFHYPILLNLNLITLS